MADGPIPSGPTISSTTTTTTTAPPPPPPSTSASPPPPPDNPSTNPTTATAATTNNSNSNNNNNNLGPGPSLAPKRQRRPSVRLGDIGADASYDHSHTHYRRPKTSWRFHKDPSIAAKTSKTRPLTNLVNGVSSSDHYHNNNEDPLDDSNAYADFTHRKPKSKKPAKRARTNWTSSSANGGLGSGIENDTLFRDEANNINNDNDLDNEDFREFGPESPVRQEQSPLNSMDMTTGLQFWDRRQIRPRVSESRDHNETMNGTHNEEDEFRSNGVRDWLSGLGLGRYAPVFEIHEVDDDVLPMLTIEDLKDMGINAVGSRRKMYSAILKLRKGFS